VNKPVRAEPEAQAELDAAVEWYERGRSGLGRELLDAWKRSSPGFGPFREAADLLPEFRSNLASAVFTLDGFLTR
jgi:hypothetical protein